MGRLIGIITMSYKGLAGSFLQLFHRFFLQQEMKYFISVKILELCFLA